MSTVGFPGIQGLLLFPGKMRNHMWNCSLGGRAGCLLIRRLVVQSLSAVNNPIYNKLHVETAIFFFCNQCFVFFSLSIFIFAAPFCP